MDASPIDTNLLLAELEQLETRAQQIRSLLVTASELGYLEATVSQESASETASAVRKRNRRTKRETDAIREAVYEALKERPVTKPSLFKELLQEGKVNDDRRDSEFVLRILKEVVKDERAEFDGRLYRWSPEDGTRTLNEALEAAQRETRTLNEALEAAQREEVDVWNGTGS